jgi:hypothetical protein
MFKIFLNNHFSGYISFNALNVPGEIYWQQRSFEGRIISTPATFKSIAFAAFIAMRFLFSCWF